MTDQQTEPTERKKLNWKAELLDYLKHIGIALIAVLIIHNFVFTLARVDGPSMLNTLHDEEIMFVWRAEYLVRAPQRGQIALCRYPGEEEHVVKRVIGLPGDRIRESDGVVYINDEPLEEPYLPETIAYDFGEITVPEGHFFVMGDNRGVSLDSRAVGPLPRNMVKGHCLFVLFPLGDWRTL